jgi:hypothetical protein
LGAETHLTAGDLRWLSPMPLWTGILSGPVAWTLDLCVSYALVEWSCDAGREDVIHAMTFAALAVVAAGAAISWTSLEHARRDEPDDGGQPRQRARFMALLGLASCAFFAVATGALAIPWWVLDACH